MVKWLKKPWPYWVGGILLGVFNVILLAISGTTWHLTTGFLLWGAGILEWIGFEPFKWEYFRIFDYKYGDIISNHNIFINKYAILNIGVIVGSLIASLLSSQFKIKRLKNKKQVVLALIGGIIMGYGARLTSGCNVGGFFSGIPSFSLHAWVYWIFVTLGAIVGTKILAKYII
ncbi:YeeE/YedE thiosulfate transporter family protein [Clostridium sp. CF012]|uniref:YeeE/YedE thiosulfate transporter family protein n=1 Tax=Clostridium sp. CF012 TaxID=2843319 RepID=UPI001C0C0EC2|nr:YeeE/YedE thiosulfate transporter family protein [Clostridium sp. CF012]MBU3142914.1 YeeE/YedE family protein [Clostridium sp. CF012]